VPACVCSNSASSPIWAASLAFYPGRYLLALLLTQLSMPSFKRLGELLFETIVSSFINWTPISKNILIIPNDIIGYVGIFILQLCEGRQ
jgi:hypothetical protein